MKTKKQILFPKHQKILEQLGENLKLARKRRHLTTIQVSERAGIDRSTLVELKRVMPEYHWEHILIYFGSSDYRMIF
jgi:hypothetical protein